MAATVGSAGDKSAATAAPPEQRRGPRHRIKVTLFALAAVIGGIGLIVGSNDATRTVTARVNVVRNLPFTHNNVVKFRYADGKDDDLNEDNSEGLFAAVAKFGPGTARVRRSQGGASIHTVVFHGKTYNISTPSDDRLGGIIALVLGLLALAWVIWRSVRPGTGDAPRSKEDEVAST